MHTRMRDDEDRAASTVGVRLVEERSSTRIGVAADAAHVANLHTIERDVLGANETEVDLPEWVDR